MLFRTEIELQESVIVIKPETKIFLSGSCFANNIASKLNSLHFNSLGNPFGVLYNSASLAAQLELIADDKKFTNEDLVEYNGTFHSFYHNSEFSGGNAAAVLKKINTSLEKTRAFANELELAVFTFGTSYVYEFNETGKVVSNCHKIPGDRFTRRMLSVEENFENIRKIVETVKSLSSGAKIIMTVSPIRHLKDGLHGNQLSKASLLLALEEIVKSYPSVEYFPSYEILLDDLRDYRFYAEDLTHPSGPAVNYIWEKFSGTYFSDEAKTFAEDMEKLLAAVNHRPINTDNPEYDKFNRRQIEKIDRLLEKYPFLDLSAEQELFFERLKNAERE